MFLVFKPVIQGVPSFCPQLWFQFLIFLIFLSKKTRFAIKTQMEKLSWATLIFTEFQDLRIFFTCQKNLSKIRTRQVMNRFVLLSTGCPKWIWTIFEKLVGESSHAYKKFSMLFKHTYSKNFWKFGGHSFNYFFVHSLSVPGYWMP